jgi:ABC-type polysaccharide/polyol phosphate export permease
LRNSIIEILRVGSHLGFQEVKQINRRSRLGQWWITLGTATLIGTIGFVFGLIFRVDVQTYLPYLAIGIVLWNYLSGQLSEASFVLIQSEALIKQLTLSPWVYATKVSAKMILMFGHNLLIIPVVLLATGNYPTLAILLLLAAVPVIVLTLNSLGMLLAIVSLRFRDVPPMVGSILNVLFYLTPVMWFADSIKSSLAHFLLGLNPFYHLVQIFRLPLLGELPTPENWLISISMCVVVSITANLVVARNRKRLVFWI